MIEKPGPPANAAHYVLSSWLSLSWRYQVYLTVGSAGPAWTYNMVCQNSAHDEQFGPHCHCMSHAPSVQGTHGMSRSCISNKWLPVANDMVLFWSHRIYIALLPLGFPQALDIPVTKDISNTRGSAVNQVNKAVLLEPHATPAESTVLLLVLLKSTPRHGIHWLQNPRKPTKYCASFLV